MSVRLDHPRPLNEAEHRVLGALLAEDFPGVDELRAQVPRAMVVGRCDCGCPTVDLEVPEDIPASSATSTTPRLAPVEGRVRSIGDEPTGDILLFVDDGRMTCLEYVTYQDPSPTEWPSLDRISVMRTD